MRNGRWESRESELFIPGGVLPVGKSTMMRTLARPELRRTARPLPEAVTRYGGWGDRQILMVG